MEPVHQFITLRCGGSAQRRTHGYRALNRCAGPTLLARTGAHGSHVMLRAADGYYEVFPFEALENGVLAYGMNGRTRPWSLGRDQCQVAHRDRGSRPRVDGILGKTGVARDWAGQHSR